MNKLISLLNKVQKLNQSELLNQAVTNPKVEKLILDLNRIDQLFNFGEDSEGISLGVYADSTKFGTSKFKGKIEKGQPIDRVTLKDTGEFYESFNINEKFNGIEIEANDIHDLIGRYGQDILGLSESSFDDALQYIRGFILAEIRKELAV
jgi:hypothetical protein